MTVAFVEAPSGCAGDMFLGALVSLGLDVSFLQDVADRMGLSDVSVSAHAVTRQGIAATHVAVAVGQRAVTGERDVHVHSHVTHSGHHPHGHTSLADVTARIERLGPLDEPPWCDALATFRALAQAEATVHDTTPEAVHFHEVGAADALVDIVGTCAGLHALGVTSVVVGPLPWGRGTIQCAHGTMPNPAPATVHLLRGHPTVPSDATFEQVTPTGAALVRHLAHATALPDGFVPSTSGFGAGTHPGQGVPNLVRVTLGRVPTTHPPEQNVCLLETNLDDTSGQVVARAVEQALSAGALDAWTTPVHMKKGRPGVVVSVLCHPSDRAAMEAVLFRETPTLGIRRQQVARTVLPRHDERVQTPWGEVRVKVRNGVNGREATPEYADCARLADEHDVPIQRVIQAAIGAWTA